MRKDNDLCSMKSNNIIQNYSWHLNKQELKIFEFLCCCYNTEYYNKENNTITISFNNFAEEVNMPKLKEQGYYYMEFKKILKNLSDKSILIDDKNYGGIIRILSEAIWNNKSGTVVCFMSNSYKEHMSKFPNGYAFIELSIINAMTSKYSIVLYNLLQSWNGKEKIVLDIDYLRKKMQVPKSCYSNFGKFKQILDNSIVEINSIKRYYEKTDFTVSYELTKTGKRYSSVTIYMNNSIDLKNLSFAYKYDKTPIELNFSSEKDKELYISNWIEYHYTKYEDNVFDRYFMLYSVIPEEVHNYEENKVNSIYDIAVQYSKDIINDRYADIDTKCELLITRFNIRKWNNDYENRVEKNTYNYYVKSFECWCKQQLSN